MLFYIVNLFLISLTACVLRKNKRLMYIVIFIWLFMLGALKGEGVGADYYSYKSFFEIFSRAEWFSSYADVERGYILLNKIISIFTNNYQWLLAVCSFLSIIGVIHFIKRNASFPIISIWLYISMGFYQSTFTRLRQAIAISIVLIAYKYAQEKKFWKFIFLIILASLFHRTALIAVLIYLFLHEKRISKQKNSRLSLFFPHTQSVTSLFSAPLIRSMVSYLGYSRYADLKPGSGGSLLLVYFLVFCYVWFLFMRSEEINPKLQLLTLLAVGSVVCQSFALTITILNRLGEFLSIPMFIMLPNTAKAFEKKSQSIVIIIMMILSFAFYVYSLSNMNGTVPYKFMW